MIAATSLTNRVAKVLCRWRNGKLSTTPFDQLSITERAAYLEQARDALDACHSVEMHELLARIASYPDANSISDAHYVIRKQARALLAKLDGKSSEQSTPDRTYPDPELDEVIGGCISLYQSDCNGSECMRQAAWYLEKYRDLLRKPKVQVNRQRLRDLLTLIRCRLERRFQTSDFVSDDVKATGNPQINILATDICAEVMGHMRGIHTLAEQALTEVEGSTA